jgi:putative peptide zinc metalloprotease protein
VTLAQSHPMWYRVAGLRPRLRAHARVHRHRYRGQDWYVLQDRASARYYRLSAAAHQFVRLLNGRLTVQEICDAIGVQAGHEAPDPEQVIGLLSKLHAADMLQSDAAPDAAEILARGQRNRRRRWQQRLLRPLAITFPLWDPDRFLVRALPLVRPLFAPLSLIVWLLAVGAGLVLAAIHWPELVAHGSARLLDPGNLLLLWLVYPVVKGLHELGHAFATRYWGGEVHEMGVMLLVLMPIPYVDASSANTFGEKRRRMAVAAAGILVELFLAASAMLLWLNVQPGLVRDVAFDVMAIGGASTVLFNGNPLLRFDGYYILADALEIPNLGARSTQHLGYLAKRYVFGLRDAPSPVTAQGERGWFLAYGLASFLYRLFISFSIALYLAGRFFFVGAVLALWALAAQLLYPVARNTSLVLLDPAFRGRRARGIAILAAAGGTLAAVVLGVPVPSWTRAEGIIKLPEQSLVRAGTDGFVVRLMSPPGQPVAPGTPLFKLEDPLLGAQVSILEWRSRELEARYSAELLNDPVQAEIFKEDLGEVRDELGEARARRERLVVYSPADGTLRVPRSADLPGRFVHKGDLLGYVADLSEATARVVVPQTAADLVRRRTEAVEVRLASQPGRTLEGHIRREVPSASEQLPSRVLGSQGGGAIAVDARDAEGVKALDRFFQFDIELPARERGGYVASRVFVRFNHGREPLGRQWYRALRQLFLARLEL